MDRLNVYPTEFVKHLLPSLKYFQACNLIFFDANAEYRVKYWRFLYLIPLFVFHYISMTLYIVKLFTEGIDPFENADMIPIWFVTTKVLSKSGEVVASQYLLVPLVETIVRNFLWNQESGLLLPYVCIYPFSINNWPTYLGVYVFQFYNVFLTVYMFYGTNLILVVLSTYLSIQFTLLQEDLIDIQPTNSNKAEFDNEEQIFEHNKWSECNIEEFIRRHQDVILLTQQFNSVFNKIVFINLLFSTLIICFFAVAAKTSTGAAYMVNNCAAIIIIMMTILITCYCGELLSASSTGVALAAAKNMWYKGNSKYQNIIIFIIMRSQKPCTLRSLNYSSVSMKTFNKVLKTTYSYFSLANQMYDARE